MKPRFYSNIYWHFTGGPVSKDGSKVWHHYRCLREVKENTTLRHPEKAMENLKNIIQSKVLQATTTEKVLEAVETDEFCCVCDIPLKDLMFHRQYYGDYAVGFNAKKIHDNFHPVLYFEPYPTKMIKIKPKQTQQLKTEGDENQINFLELLGINQSNPLVNFLKLTHFDSDYDDSFYGEREWRCLDDFHFTRRDVEAVIVPKDHVNDIGEFLNGEGFRNISVLSWDLIENI
ncbi:Putative abortive phage resistance protein AbiGi, antitoxin [Salinibacillus kushneri]|uniref:Putative abortive phage resistance protein AbiGi, antitoxin n=1 Tax=Salinibacillus kushneri TaxID=237682 RepID=A0A1I0H193_9BACI|nr:abortive infection system antitoxin AbiGi family protein [Salinibacillus kushneri]SET77463.1 Putative abortive phage resistance protein AbiGi, antitoxin [Salinibacillus kushneri]